MNNVDYKRYFCPKIYQKELDQLFSKLWIYGAALPEFDEEKPSYVLVNTPMGEIIITKNNLEFNAFFNKCAHRGHPLVTERRGNLNLVCPYHCWSYHNNGSVKNIPFSEKMYGLNENDLSKMSLKKVAVKRLGDFIFLNTSDFPIDIEDQFKPNILESLEKTKDMLNKTYANISVSFKFNWKLIFENLRDCIHPLFLHPNSLAKEVDFYATFKKPEVNKRPIENLTELSEFSRDGVTKLPDEDYRSNFLICDDGKSYLNWILFPYTHIPSPDGGTLFAVENFIPIDENTTRLDLSFFITKSKSKSRVLVESIFYEWFQKAKVVLSEDLVAVEALQSQIKSGHDIQFLGDYENQNVRINEFLDREVYAK